MIPILVIVFRRGKIENYVPISIVLSILLSYIIQPYVDDFQSIWISASISLFTIIICTIFNFIYSSWKLNFSK
jgi:uncharacterized membrane protein YGL010W